MVIDGQEKTYRGTIVLGSADNLASQLIGGYKSLASAVRKCRFCLAVNDDMVSKVNSGLHIILRYNNIVFFLS